MLPPVSAGKMQQLRDGATGNDALVSHLLQNFNERHSADTVLCISEANERFDEMTFYLHHVMLERSPTISALMRQHAGEFDEDHKLKVSLQVNSRFATPKSIEAALRSCYGAPCTSFWEKTQEDNSAPFREESREIMAESVGLLVAGHVLRLLEVMDVGYNMVSNLANHYNLDYAVGFALEASDHRINGPERSNDSIPCDDCGGPRSNANALLEILLNRLFDACLPVWEFRPAAKPLCGVDRLPYIRNPRKTKQEWLSEIKFGFEFDEDRQDMEDFYVMTSSVLLSLPWDNLCTFLIEDAQRGGPVHAAIDQIVEERERRRKAVLNNDIVDLKRQRLAMGPQWMYVGVEEYVADDHPDVKGKWVAQRHCIMFYSVEDEAGESDEADTDHPTQNPLGELSL